jgi:branched-chain amino acid transport system ATP-binding protein
LENVLTGMHRLYTYSPAAMLLNLPIQRREEKLMREKAMEILDLFHLANKAKRQAESLSYGEQRKLELARALATSPKLLLVDEPAAGMNPAETEELMGEIVQINNRGYTICLIEHDMKFVMGVCRQVAVLNFGELIALGTPQEVKCNPLVIEAYLGKDACNL